MNIGVFLPEVGNPKVGGVYYYNVDNKTISEDQFYSIIKNSKRR